jgi:hypothetical protein
MANDNSIPPGFDLSPWQNKDPLTLSEAACLWAGYQPTLSKARVLEPYRFAVAKERFRQIKQAAEAGRIDYERPDQIPRAVNEYGRITLSGWRRGGTVIQTTDPEPVAWEGALFTRAALKGYADSIGERPAFLFPEAEQQACPVVAVQGAPALDTKEPPQEWRNGLKRIAYEEAVKLIRAHGVLHGPALWAAMKARDDVKEAGRDSDKIEPKVCESKLTRGEARVSKTQVQNDWRKSLAELLK